MTSNKIALAGDAYVRSRDAARAVDLSADYVSRLAKRGLIDGKRIDDLWYVNARSLAAFLLAEERKKELWRVQLSEFRREERRRAEEASALFP